MTAPATISLTAARKQRRKAKAAGWRLEFQKLRNVVRLCRHWWLRTHTQFQPLFVLATHRSGSNLLIDYLNRQDGIACHSEVLCPSLDISPIGQKYSQRRALRHLRMSLQTLTAPVRGCKLMLDQLDNAELSVPVMLENFPEARFLVLYRQSLAEQFLSLKTATVTQQWVLRSGEQPRDARVHVERNELRVYCDKIKYWYRRLLNSPGLEERAVLLSYEELTADPQYWLGEQICPLVDRPASPPETMLCKQNARPISQRVENYREVEALMLSPICQQSYAWPGQRQLTRRAA